MAKAQLQAAQQAYDASMTWARRAEQDGLFAQAIQHAMSAWDHVEDMMRFERRFEDAEFSSVPCVDLVLRLSPLILDAQALDRLGELLKTRKAVDRHASDDLAGRLLEARAFLRTAHRLWDHLEQSPGCRQDHLNDALGGDQSTWRGLAERWDRMGLLNRRAEGASYRLWLATDLQATVRAKCMSCGHVHSGSKRRFLEEQPCPQCQQVVAFVMREESAESPVAGGK